MRIEGIFNITPHKYAWKETTLIGEITIEFRLRFYAQKFAQYFNYI